MAQAASVDCAWGELTSGQQALVTLAPTAASALAALERAAWATEARGLLRQAAALCASNLQLAARTPGGSEATGGADAVALGFAEQFSVDVSSTSDEQRTALFDVLGPLAGPYVQGLYVVDFFPRTRAVLDALFGPTDPSELPPLVAGGPASDDLWGTAMEFLRIVAVLGSLDPVTAELVRLRGASQHRCRLCKSLRNRSAIEAGASDEQFAAVDADRTALSDVHQAALALADAMIWTPGHLQEGVVEDIRRYFSPEQAVALVLWVTRNSSNKIAVALAGDAPHVTEGIEIYDLDATGEPVYGMTLT